MNSVPNDEKDLYKALLSLETEEECHAFVHDLCTPAEIKSMQERWLVAEMLDKSNYSYREIHDKTGVSIATITRVARFLNHEKYHGYRNMLDKKRRGVGKFSDNSDVA